MKLLKALSLSVLLVFGACSKTDTPESLEEPANQGGGIVIAVGNDFPSMTRDELNSQFVQNMEDSINATVKVRYKNALGSGFVVSISREPGRGKWVYTILSAAHIFANESLENNTPLRLNDESEKVTATFYNNRNTKVLYGDIVSLDTISDLAIVKIYGSDDGLPICKSFWFYNGNDYLKYMNDVAIIGYPQGVGPIVTAGHISGISVLDWDKDAYTTTAQSAPGSSGGPVVDMETGKVIGMIRAVLRMPSNNQLILWTSIITPVDTLKKFVGDYYTGLYLPERVVEDVVPVGTRGEDTSASGTFTPPLMTNGDVLVFTPYESKQVFYNH